MTQVIDPQTAPPCVHCNHPYSDHERHPAPPDVAVYVPCTVCDCTGYADNDPWGDGDELHQAFDAVLEQHGEALRVLAESDDQPGVSP